MKVISSFLQFIIGVIVGLVLLAAGAFGIGYFIFMRMAVNPPQPIFAEERPKPVTAKPAETTASSPKNSAPTKPTDSASTATEAEKAEEEQEVEDEETLEPGAYKARVTWPQGLSVRAEATTNAERVGGVGYNAEIIILKDSEDKNWQQIRIPSSGQEGWVKAGNVEKVEE
ncbi:MAG: SH3 domain-containing protein [Cyanobacteriota bacterium]